YYADEDQAKTGGTNNIFGNLNFTQARPVWIRVDSPEICAPIITEIQLNTGTKISLIKDEVSTEVCDSNNDSAEIINLTDYISPFTDVAGTSVSFFESSQNAYQNTNPISGNPTISGDRNFYLRISAPNFCTSVATLKVKFKNVTTSKTLPESVSVCLGNSTTLDAGTGFESYVWSTGANTQSITVPVGEYWVDLISNNGCVYRQSVSVKNVVLPEIERVDIQGSTVTVLVTNGTAPYRYSLDGGPYQISNIFTSVGGGNHTISVISADNCTPVTTLIDVILQYNVITPNGDGINDVFNYSYLMKKSDPLLQIFDRYGKLVFTGDSNNRFIWDGKQAGKILATGSYWYTMQWKEPGSDRVTQYSSWIMIKNRE
ncbi:MAG: T9SS type B sorting domain-containing protein, partial [Kaistella sp.]